MIRAESPLDCPGLRRPHWGSTKTRLDALCDRYVTPAALDGLVADLPSQLESPRARPWPGIDWKSINSQQILDVPPETFLAIVAGAAVTEAPIRGYAWASRQYLDQRDPRLARLIGGSLAADGTLDEIGLWEREERRHAPALRRLWRHLSGRPWTEGECDCPQKSARPYAPSADPHRDLFRHGLHRIVTEYAAACLYLWLAARTTGPLQQLFLEILQDELNHLAKFWCIGRWLYPHPARELLAALGHNSRRGSHTLRYMGEMLAWSRWGTGNQVELAYTFARVLVCMLRWSARLDASTCDRLLAAPADCHATVAASDRLLRASATKG